MTTPLKKSLDDLQAEVEIDAVNRGQLPRVTRPGTLSDVARDLREMSSWCASAVESLQWADEIDRNTAVVRGIEERLREVILSASYIAVAAGLRLSDF